MYISWFLKNLETVYLYDYWFIILWKRKRIFWFLPRRLQNLGSRTSPSSYRRPTWEIKMGSLGYTKNTLKSVLERKWNLFKGTSIVSEFFFKVVGILMSERNKLLRRCRTLYPTIRYSSTLILFSYEYTCIYYIRWWVDPTYHIG